MNTISRVRDYFYTLRLYWTEFIDGREGCETQHLLAKSHFQTFCVFSAFAKSQGSVALINLKKITL